MRRYFDYEKFLLSKTVQVECYKYIKNTNSFENISLFHLIVTILMRLPFTLHPNTQQALEFYNFPLLTYILFVKQILMKAVILLFLTLSISLAGDIYTGDIQTFNNNNGFINSMSFTMQFTNSLWSQYFIRIDFPIGFNPGFISNYSNIGVWATQLESCDPLTFISGNNIEGRQQSSSVFLYLTSNATNQSLSNQYIYTVNLNLPTAISPSAGLYAPFSIYTVPTDNPSITPIYAYDQNIYAGSIEIVAAPTLNAIQISLATPDGTDLGYISSTNSVQFSIQPSTLINAEAKLSVRFVNGYYNFVAGSCKLSGTYAGTPTFEDGTSILSISLVGTLNNTIPFVFNCTIQSPNFVQTDMLNVETFLYGTSTIVENTNFTSSLISCNPLTWYPYGFSIGIGWGYNISNTSNVARPMLFYRSTTAYPVYNTIWLYFMNGEIVVQNQENSVTVQTVNDPAFHILTSSITTSLPSSSKSVPICSINSVNQITCTNVGPLGNCSTCTYYVAFKFTYVGTSDITFPSTFGQISLYSSSGHLIISAGQATLASSLSKTTLNPQMGPIDLNSSDSNFRADTLVHSINYENTTVTNRYFGIHANSGNNVTLLFSHYWQKFYVTTSAFANGDGVEYFTTPNIEAMSTTPYCQGTSGTTVALCEIKTVSLSSSNNMTRFRFSLTPATASLQFPSLSTVTNIEFSNVSIQEVSSFKIVDESVYDIYGRGVPKALFANLTDILTAFSNQNFLINAYALSYTPFSNFNISLSSVWSNSTYANDGSLFPTVVVVQGLFNDNEADLIEILSIFFTTLTPYSYTGNYSCGFSGQVPLSCEFKSAGDNQYSPLYSARLDVYFTTALNYATSNVFSFSFPVIAPSNLESVWLGAGASRGIPINNDYTPSYLYFHNFLTLPISESDPQLLVENHFYAFQLPIGVRFNDQDTSGITNIPLNFQLNGESTINPGASIQFCGVWEGFSGSAFAAVFSNLGLGTRVSCANYEYTYNSSTRYCALCPFNTNYNTTSKPLMISGLTYPPYVFSGNDLFVAYSDNSSLVKTVYTDTVSKNLEINYDLTIVRVFSNPPTLTFNSELNRISVQFVPGYPLPPSSEFAVLFSTNNEFTLTLHTSTSVCTLLYESVITTCTVAASGSTWTITGVPSSYEGAQGVIQINIDGFDITSSSSSSNLEGTVAVQVIVNSVIVQQNWEFENATIYMYKSTSPYTNMGLTYYNNTWFDYPVTGIYSRFYMSFGVQKAPDQVLSSYLIQVPLPSSSLPSAFNCLVFESGVISLHFIECSFKNSTHLQLQAESSPLLPMSFNFTVQMDHVLVPSSSATIPAITIGHVVGSTTIAYSTHTVSYSLTTTTALSGLTFTKLFNTPGEPLELNLEFSAPFAIDSFSRLIMHFPYYYPEALITKQIACLVQNINRPCIVIAERTLMIYGSLLQVENGENVEITIYGVIQPLVTSVAHFHFVINNGEFISPFYMSTTMADTLPSSLPTNFEINNATLSVKDVRSITNLEVYFYINSTTNTEDTLINIWLPHSYVYDLFQGDVSYECTMTLIAAQSLLYSPFCSRVGSRLTVQLQDSVPTNSEYTLKIYQIYNPFSEFCNSDRAQLTISSRTGSYVYSRSSSNSLNMVRYNYTTQNEYNELLVLQNNEELNQSAVFNLTMGTFSLPFTISVPTGDYFQGETQFFINQLYFYSLSQETYSSVVMVYQGFPSITMILGCDTITVESEYEVKIWKAEFDGHFYNEPPRVRVQIVTTPIIVPVPSSLSIPIGGQSLPIQFNFENYLPYDYITITLKIPTNAETSLSSITRPVCNFLRSSYICYLQLQASSSVNLGSFFQVNLELGGNNEESYILQNTEIAVSFVQASSVQPSVTFTKPEALISNQQEISVVSTETGVLYYVVVINQTESFNCESILSGYQNFKVYSRYDPLQSQYGTVLIKASGIQYQFTLNNMRAAGSYMLSACLESQMSVWSNLTLQSFTMKDNNYSIFQVNITYSQQINVSLETQYLCFLTQYYSVPMEAIISAGGTYCNYTNPLIENVSYSFVNNSLTYVSKMTRQTYYFYTDRERTTQDHRFDTLAYDLSLFYDNTTKFGAALAAWQAKNPTYPSISNFTYMGMINKIPPKLSGTLQLQTGSTYISLLNATIDQYGYIVAGLNSSGPSPFFHILRTYALGQENPKMNFAYRINSTQSLTFNFTNLIPGTMYYLAVYTKNLDDTFLTSISDPVIFNVETPYTDLLPAKFGNIQSLPLVGIITLLITLIFA